jgi:hypothetical protein
MRYLLPALLLVLTAGAQAHAAERETVVTREAYACTSWAGWREYNLLLFQGGIGRVNRHCPIRIPVRARVEVTDEDPGFGAVEICYRGRYWFVDGESLKQ